VVDRPPAKFRRTRGTQPLPEPERGGSLEELRPFFNVDHQGWILIRAFLVAALRPGFPLPILVAKGEQGAGKSTACRLISSLIDPRTSALRGVPREVRELSTSRPTRWSEFALLEDDGGYRSRQQPETPGSCVSIT
jgi:hypothetical protein